MCSKPSMGQLLYYCYHCTGSLLKSVGSLTHTPRPRGLATFPIMGSLTRMWTVYHPQPSWWNAVKLAWQGTVSLRHHPLPQPRIIGLMHLGIWNLHTVQGVMDGSGNRAVSQLRLSYPSRQAAEPSVLSPCSWQAGMCPPSQVTLQPPPRAGLWGPSAGVIPTMPHSITWNPSTHCLPETLMVKPWLPLWTRDAEWDIWCAQRGSHLASATKDLSCLYLLTVIHSQMFIECLLCTWHWARTPGYSCEWDRHSPHPKGLTFHWRVWTLKILDIVPITLPTCNLVLKGSL